MFWRNALRAGSTVLALGLVILAPQHARAQSATRIKAAPSQLSLPEAIQLARQESPDLLTSQNSEIDARWAVKEAYASLLPTASIGTGFSYSAAGTPQLGIFSSSDFGISRTPSYLSSSWGLNFGYTFSGSKLYNTSAQKALRRAATSQVDVAATQLDMQVTRQYITALRAQDALTLAREQLASANENFRMADAKVKVGSAIALEAKQAQVERDRAQVAVLRAENDVAAQKLQLGQSIGMDVPADVKLTTTFAVFMPQWKQADLLQRALRAQPQIRAAAAQEDAARAQIQAARTQYLPSLSLSLGFSGWARESGSSADLVTSAQRSLANAYAGCQTQNLISAGLKTPLPGYPLNCGSAELTADQRAAIIAGNNVFPFHYTSQPWSAQMQISLPIFGGLTRERQLESARLQSDNARLRSKAQELQVRTAVSTAYATLLTAQKAFEIEKASKDAAAEQLALEQERYRVGSSNFVQLQDAQTRKATADKAYLDALYGFHDALAVLENAVGEKLETPTDK